MKIVIPGGSGHLGVLLADAFHRERHEVVVLSRQPGATPWRVVPWDGVSLGAWANELDRADVVINLAGRSVNCRYTATNRRDILDSRLASTRIVGRAIAQAVYPPRVWLQMSTATIYAHRYDAANDERTGQIGGAEPDAPAAWRFSIDVARAWEAALADACTRGTRKVAVRAAVVMSPQRDGPFDLLLRLVRYGLGGRAGDGRQYVSWVHDDDFVESIRWLICHDEISGVVNIASPNPLPNAAFMQAIRDAAGVRFGLPAGEWMLSLGAFALRTETELLLKSRHVTSTRLIESGFTFRHPIWREAALDLYRRARQTH